MPERPHESDDDDELSDDEESDESSLDCHEDCWVCSACLVEVVLGVHSDEVFLLDDEGVQVFSSFLLLDEGVQVLSALLLDEGVQVLSSSLLDEGDQVLASALELEVVVAAALCSDEVGVHFDDDDGVQLDSSLDDDSACQLVVAEAGASYFESSDLGAADDEAFFSSSELLHDLVAAALAEVAADEASVTLAKLQRANSCGGGRVSSRSHRRSARAERTGVDILVTLESVPGSDRDGEGVVERGGVGDLGHDGVVVLRVGDLDPRAAVGRDRAELGVVLEGKANDLVRVLVVLAASASAAVLCGVASMSAAGLVGETQCMRAHGSTSRRSS